MKSKCGGCKAPSREDMAQPSAAAKPVTHRKAWNGPTKAITAAKLFAIKIIFGKEWCIMMAMFFAQRVILGKTTFEQVPKALKKGVAEVLIDSGLPELVPTEYGGTADVE